jgi:hypothetical protein
MSQYRVRNWSEYSSGLKQRGSLTFYTNQAIVTMISLKSVFGLPERIPPYCIGVVESSMRSKKKTFNPVMVELHTRHV